MDKDKLILIGLVLVGYVLFLIFPLSLVVTLGLIFMVATT